MSHATNPDGEQIATTCKVCGRLLTESTSVKFGIGPVCFSKFPELANMTTEEDVDAFILKKRGEGLLADRQLTPDEAKEKFAKYKGKEWREHQKEAVEWILKSNKKVTMLAAPTGMGKSMIAMVSGMATGTLTYIVHSKILQNQICDDHPEAEILFGRSNYPCIAANDDGRDLDCAECIHTENSPCELKRSCKYDVAKAKALAARLKVVNTDYFLSETNYVGKFSGAPFVVVDEADVLESSLLAFVTLTFTKYALRRLGLQIQADELQKTSKYPDKLMEQWKMFGNEANRRALLIIKKLSDDIDDLSDPQSDEARQMMKEKTRVVRLQEKIMLFLENVAPDWILEDDNDRLTWRPLWLTPTLAEKYFWRHGAKFALLSASFLPVHIEAKRLGLDLDDVAYKSLPSTFPVENRRTIVRPVADLVSKNMDIEVPKIIREVKHILSQHPDERGMIHGISYKLSQQVYEGVNNSRLMIHNSSNRQDVLNEFLESDNNAVLISPSMDRGLSLDMDKARFQVILKMPWLSLGDKIVKARVYSGWLGKEWFQATALLTVLQMCGRSTRSKDDYSVTYILDNQFKRVLLLKPSFLPKWFKDSMEFE